MNWHEVNLDEVFASPWRNGGGSTRELLAWPHKEHDKDEWQVRVSVAQIDKAGPFSSYPGIERWIAVLSGEGVLLRVDGQAHRLDGRSDPLRFDGAARADCELTGGASEDFNVMLRGRSGSLRRVSGRHEVACSKGSLVGIYSHEHEVAFLAVQVRIVVPPRTLAWNVMPIDERIEFDTRGALCFEVQS